jgi:hypothetical protein
MPEKRKADPRARSASARPGIHVFLRQPREGVDGRVIWRDDALCPAMTFIYTAIISQQSERILGVTWNAGGQ